MNSHFATSVMFKRASWVRAAKMRNIYVGSVEDSSDIISQSIDDEVRILYFDIAQPMHTHKCEHTYMAFEKTPIYAIQNSLTRPANTQSKNPK